MTTPDPIEARLRNIEDTLGGDIDCEGSVLDDVAWLVGLVRRYRRALESIRDTEWPPGHSISGARDMKETAREALNEEVPPA